MFIEIDYSVMVLELVCNRNNNNRLFAEEALFARKSHKHRLLARSELHFFHPKLNFYGILLLYLGSVILQQSFNGRRIIPTHIFNTILNRKKRNLHLGEGKT